MDGTRALVAGEVAKEEQRGDALVSLAEEDFEGVWCVCALSVADAFELAAELGCGVVGVSVFFFVVGFGLALFDGVVEVGLGEGLEGDEGEA
jgi:hypothetical protein